MSAPPEREQAIIVGIIVFIVAVVTGFIYAAQARGDTPRCVSRNPEWLGTSAGMSHSRVVRRFDVRPDFILWGDRGRGLAQAWWVNQQCNRSRREVVMVYRETRNGLRLKERCWEFSWSEPTVKCYDPIDLTP